MTRPAAQISPAHPLIREYQRSLADLRGQGVEHELGLRRPFENLLADSARLHGWRFVAEVGAKAGGHRIRPDGTVFDANSLPRGFWESKDSHDDLDREIDRGPPRFTISSPLRLNQVSLYQELRQHYRNPAIAKWDIFHYIYAVLHHPAHREKFADSLKRELPRIPFAPDFADFAAAGSATAPRSNGSWISTASPKTTAAASSPTPTARTIRSTSSASWARWCASASRPCASSVRCRQSSPGSRREGARSNGYAIELANRATSCRTSRRKSSKCQKRRTARPRVWMESLATREPSSPTSPECVHPGRTFRDR